MIEKGFQKDLIVWKRGKRDSEVCSEACFRRT